MTETIRTPREQFLKDSADFLSALNGALLTLEKNPSDMEIVNEFFRLIHSLKSEASYLGLDEITEKAHDLESFFETVRSGQWILSADDFDSLFPAIDEIEDLVRRQEPEHEQTAEPAGLGTEELDRPGPAVGGEGAAAPIPERTGGGQRPAVPIGFSPFEKSLLAEARDRGERLYRLVCDIDPAAPMKFAKAYLVVNNLEQLVTVIRVDPPLDGGTEIARLDICFTSSVDEKAIYRAVTLDQIEKIQLAALDYATFLGAAGEIGQARETVDSRGAGAVLRVEMGKVDDLLRDIDELKYLVRSMASRKGELSVRGGLVRIAEVAESIGDAAREMRVVRIGEELSRLHRLVRDLSRKLGKEGVLDIIGSDLEIDRGIVDLLFDPLVHLVRNAMDHGIEAPEERERRGKPRTGTVTIRSSSAQGRLVIAVRDDGGGIDEEAVLRRARSMGLAEEADRRDILAVLAHPGFSMRSEATPLSGRGVGLDLVRRRIGQIAGGSLSLVNRPGEGSEFTITVPASSLMSVTLARYGGLTIGIPGRSIDGVEEAEAERFTRDEEGCLFYGNLPVFSVFGRVAVSDGVPEERFLVRIRVGSVSGWILAEELLFEREVPEREFVIREEEKPYLYRVEIGGRKADYLLFNPAMIALTPAPAPVRS